jgi:hypothetical protein
LTFLCPIWTSREDSEWEEKHSQRFVELINKVQNLQEPLEKEFRILIGVTSSPSMTASHNRLNSTANQQASDMSTEARRGIEHVLKIVSAMVTVGGLLSALAQFIVSQTVEAQKPYLEKKVTWCEEATNTAAVISVRGCTCEL